MIAVHPTRYFNETHDTERADSADTLLSEEQLLQDVRDDHVQLRRLLSLVRKQLRARRSGTSLIALAGIFDQLRDQLALHFTLKMSFGYLTDAVEVAPRLHRQAEELQREQFLLFLEVCEIADDAQDLLYSSKISQSERLELLNARFETFSFELDAHDVRERDLIYQALCDDIGVGD